MECREWKKSYDLFMDKWVNSEDNNAELPENLYLHAAECALCGKKLSAFQSLKGKTIELAEVPPFLAAQTFSGIKKCRKNYSRDKRFSKIGSMLAAAAAVLVIAVSVDSVRSYLKEGYFEAGEISTDKVVNIDSIRDGTAEVTVMFYFEAPAAQEVAVVGDWNGWNPDLHILQKRNSEGMWEIEITLTSGREYRYQFLVDKNNWKADPESILQIDDGFGNISSILDI